MATTVQHLDEKRHTFFKLANLLTLVPILLSIFKI
ncbi:uncharacterized protein METZ01_LOCUS35385, partial [marine metagenome]